MTDNKKETYSLSKMLPDYDISTMSQEELEEILIGQTLKRGGQDPFSFTSIGKAVAVDKENDNITFEMF